jgi:S1-C subfamily serine protease
MKNKARVWLMLVAPLVISPALAQPAQNEPEVLAIQAEQDLQRAEVEKRMREAEQRLAEAAQQIAELSGRQLPRVAEIQRQFLFDGRPKLGITIGDNESSPAEGVRIMGVSPGGAADEAGLRAGDTITAINGESFKAGSAGEANEKLLDFMSGVEIGDVLKVDYLRKGKVGSVEMAPQLMNIPESPFGGPDFKFAVPVAPMAPGAPPYKAEKWAWMFGDSGFGDMELVSLTEGLGKYFGTAKGLLVVRAPENKDFKLEDGDVIRLIDGREPKSVSHAMRILGSYQGGETLEMEIMRDKKRQKISIEMPDNRQSRLGAGLAPPAAPVAPTPGSDDRT